MGVRVRALGNVRAQMPNEYYYCALAYYCALNKPPNA